jgi:hypothetical protein
MAQAAGRSSGSYQLIVFFSRLSGRRVDALLLIVVA